LTLATAEAIAETSHADPPQIAEHLAQHWALSGLGGDRAAGNGAAMRIAPAAFLLDPSVVSERQTLRDIARITHRNDESITAALALAAALRLAMAGEHDRKTAIESIIAILPDTLVRDALSSSLQHSAVDPAATIDRIGSSGYAPESVPLAITLGFTKWGSAQEALECAVRHTEDADTVASMLGQILGAGGHQLPSQSLDTETATRISQAASALARTANVGLQQLNTWVH